MPSIIHWENSLTVNWYNSNTFLLCLNNNPQQDCTVIYSTILQLWVFFLFPGFSPMNNALLNILVLYSCIWVILFIEYTSRSKHGWSKFIYISNLTDNVTFKRLLQFIFSPVTLESAFFFTFLSSTDIIFHFSVLLIWQVKICIN